VIEVVSLSDKAVRERVRVRAGQARPVIVSGVRTASWMKPVAEREPFAAIDDLFGARVDQLVVADSGSIEGMWRDPLGDLAEACFPDDRQKAYAAASGYLLLVGGKAAAVVKKHGSAKEDLWFLHDALARAHLAPAPDPAKRPGKTKQPRAAPRARAPEREPESGPEIADEPTPRPAPPPRALDPWAVLGIAPGTSAADARKAFRTLISQYHPDKVAHLAPEFQELADRKTRELLAAWELVQQALGE
jgi:hypothetical protein